MKDAPLMMLLASILFAMFIVVAVLLFEGTIEPNRDLINNTSSQSERRAVMDSLRRDHFKLDVLKVEGCEYLVYAGRGLTHKGNCNNPIHKTMHN